MRDQQNRAGVVRQNVLQHFLGGQVQVVGGLVQQEQVGVRQRQLGQRQASAFSAGEGLHARKDFLAGKAVLRQVAARFSRQHGGGDKVNLLY